MAGFACVLAVGLVAVWQPWNEKPSGGTRYGESVWLTASARPSSAIFVDGKQYVARGEVRDLELDTGPHEVRLVPVDGTTPEGLFSVVLDEEGERQNWCFVFRSGAWQAERCGP